MVWYVYAVVVLLVAGWLAGWQAVDGVSVSVFGYNSIVVPYFSFVIIIASI
jgi:hypothetical protein